MPTNAGNKGFIYYSKQNIFGFRNPRKNAKNVDFKAFLACPSVTEYNPFVPSCDTLLAHFFHRLTAALRASESSFPSIM